MPRRHHDRQKVRPPYSGGALPKLAGADRRPQSPADLQPPAEPQPSQRGSCFKCGSTDLTHEPGTGTAHPTTQHTCRGCGRDWLTRVRKETTDNAAM